MPVIATALMPEGNLQNSRLATNTLLHHGFTVHDAIKTGCDGAIEKTIHPQAFAAENSACLAVPVAGAIP